MNSRKISNYFKIVSGDLEEEDDPENPMQVVELTESKSLTAVFKPMYTLTMAREGDGGTVSPSVDEPHEYREGTQVNLSAFGTDEWIFDHWSGAVTGSLPIANLTLAANKSATEKRDGPAPVTSGGRLSFRLYSAREITRLPPMRGLVPGDAAERLRTRCMSMRNSIVLSKKTLIAASICATTGFLALTATATPVSLEPLTPQIWTVSHRLNRNADTPIAFALRASGKQLEVDYADVEVEEAAVYGDPLSACAAVLNAAFTLDEVWWGGLSAPAESRGQDGLPASSYTPDSQANWYTLFTAHTRNAAFPAPTAVDIMTYMRVGGLHGFIVKWTLSNPDSTTRTANDLIPIQEFSPGKYRFAPEWMGPNEPIAIALKDCQPEPPAFRDYRESSSTYAREVEVSGLFGDGEGAYPLTLLFRAMLLENYPSSSGVQTLQQNIASLAAQIPEEENEYEGSPAQQGLAGLLTESSLRTLGKQSIDKRRDISFFDDGALVLDADKFAFLLRRDERTGEIDKAMAQIYNDNGTFKLANFRVQGGVTRFLLDPRIWGPLSAELNEVLGAATE